MDCCGGSGIIALEAATTIPNVQATRIAQMNADAAVARGLLADGASVEVRQGAVESLDTSLSELGHFDAVVSELPFGSSYQRRIWAEPLLNSLSRTLRQISGRAVLVIPRCDL